MQTRYVPGYKVFGSAVGLLYIALASSMLVRGARAAMGPFGVPEHVLRSAHYADFVNFTFVHMAVLGLLTVMLACFVTDGSKQRTVAGVWCVTGMLYAYLDVRTTDSFLGNGLYKGSGPLIPVLIDVVVALGWAYLASRRQRELPSAP